MGAACKPGMGVRVRTLAVSIRGSPHPPPTCIRGKSLRGGGAMMGGHTGGREGCVAGAVRTVGITDDTSHVLQLEL